jgi:hypothetical protein
LFQRRSMPCYVPIRTSKALCFRQNPIPGAARHWGNKSVWIAFVTRCVRIFLITAGSSRQLLPAWLYLLHPCSRILAIILTSPPHLSQISIYPRAPSLDAAHQFTLSMLNTRFNRWAHWSGCPGAAEHTDVRERPGHGCPALGSCLVLVR